MKKVKVIFPDGSIGEVNESDLQSALAAGAKRYTNGQAVKKVQMQFADGSMADVDSSDVETAISSGASLVKKKETAGLVDAGIGGIETIQSELQSPEEDFRTSFQLQPELPISRNPRASISELVSYSDLPEDARFDLKSKILSGDLEAAKEVIKQAKEKIKSSGTVSSVAAQSLIPLPGLSIKTEIFPDEIKKIDEDAENYISSIRLEQPYNSLKQVGESIRKDLFDIGVTKNGNPYQELKIKSQLYGQTGNIIVGYGRGINVEKTKEEIDYNNYVSGLVGRARYLDNKFSELMNVSGDKINKYLSALKNKTDVDLDEFKDDPDIESFKNIYSEFYDIKNKKLPNSAEAFPHQKFMQERQKVKEFIGNRMKENFNSIVPDLKNDEDDIEDVSEMLGVTKERAKELINSVDIPSIIGQVWRSASNTLESQGLGLLRVFGEPDLISKSIEQSRMAEALPESLTTSSKNINLLSSLYTAADVLGQVGVFAVEGAIGGRILGAIGKGVSKTLPQTPFFSRTPLVQSFKRAGELGTTFTSGFLADYETAYQEVLEQTNDEAKARNFAGWRAGITGASELLLPDVDFAKRLAGIRKLSLKTFEDIGEKGLTKASFLRGLGEFGKIVGVENLEEQMPIIGTKFLQEGIFNRTIPLSELIDESINTAIVTTIGTTPLGIIGGFRKPASGFKKANYYEASVNPSEQLKNIQEAFQDGEISEDKMNEHIKIVNILANINKNVVANATDRSGNPLTEKQKHDLTYSILKQEISNESKEKSVPALQKFFEEDINEAQKEVDQIMSGSETKPLELNEAEQSVIDKILSDKELPTKPDTSLGRQLFESAQDPKNHRQIIETLVDQSNDQSALMDNVGVDVLDAVNKLGEESKFVSPDQMLAKEGVAQPELTTSQVVKGQEEVAPSIEEKYPIATNEVDGRIVRDKIPNMASIDASLNEYEVLPEVREISFSEHFPDLGEIKYATKSDRDRATKLANDIIESGEINPLIVVIDKEGPYILEGSNRFDALRELGAKSFPAKVVLDLESLNQLKSQTEKQQSITQSKNQQNEKVIEQTTENQTTAVQPEESTAEQTREQETKPEQTSKEAVIQPEERVRLSTSIRNIAAKIKSGDITGAGGEAALSDITKIPREIVAYALNIVADAIQSGEAVADAIKKGIDYLSSQGHKDADAKGNFTEFIKAADEGREPRIKYEAEPKKIQKKLSRYQTAKTIKDIDAYLRSGLAKDQVQKILEEQEKFTPQIKKFLDYVYSLYTAKEGTEQNKQAKEESKIAEGQKIMDDLFSKIRRGEKIPKTFVRLSNSDVQDLIPYLKDKFSTYKSISLDQLETVADNLIDIFGVDVASQMVNSLDIQEKPIALAKIAMKFREDGRNKEAAQMMAQLIQTGTATGQAVKSFDRVKTLIGSVNDPTFRTEFQKAMYERDQQIAKMAEAEFNIQSDVFKQKMNDLEKAIHTKTISDNENYISKFIDRICSLRKRK